MNIYIGDYWLDFPTSEYGGMWTVIAENETDCARLLQHLNCPNPKKKQQEIEQVIQLAVKKAKCFALKDYKGEATVLNHFFT